MFSMKNNTIKKLRCAFRKQGLRQLILQATSAIYYTSEKLIIKKIQFILKKHYLLRPFHFFQASVSFGNILQIRRELYILLSKGHYNSMRYQSFTSYALFVYLLILALA